jgi:hypothetical protein
MEDTEEHGWGRVVVKKRQRSVDLAFKIKEKSEETGQKTPRQQHNHTPLLQRRHLEMKLPAKTKEITKKKKKKKKNPQSEKRRRESTPHHI